jgi:hypothetical protein
MALLLPAVNWAVSCVRATLIPSRFHRCVSHAVLKIMIDSIAVVKTSLTLFGDGVKSLLSDPTQLSRLVGATVALAAGVYCAREGAKLTRQVRDMTVLSHFCSPPRPPLKCFNSRCGSHCHGVPSASAWLRSLAGRHWSEKRPGLPSLSHYRRCGLCGPERSQSVR